MEKKVSTSVKQTTSVAVTSSKSVSIAKFKQLISNVVKEFPDSKNKVPVTITKGDNWLCIASVIGKECITISLTELK